MKKKEKATKVKKSKKKFIHALGRRKTAVARLRLFKGKGKMVVNSKPIEEYFPGKEAEYFYLEPFKVTDTLGKYYATIKVKGSGKNAQLGAVIHAFSRALDKENKETYHVILKKHGLLTRDPRAKERRKVGQGGKARAKKQSPKR